MEHLITAVDMGSIAEELDICPGMCLVAIDGREVQDIIDYEQLTAAEELTLTLRAEDGEEWEAEIEKELYEPLGLSFAHGGLMSPVRSCKNRCVFCFIDQMPKGVRDTLHVKDDDWRLSLIMGNYVTLTNVDEAEFARMLERKVSPLYISVHATDGEVRRRMMANHTAANLMERLAALKGAGIDFHCQVVLCPGLNDGEVLERTIGDLYGLGAASLAVVPVGLTKYRDGLYPLRCLTSGEAGAAIDAIESWQRKSLKERGERFVFPSDEMYILSGRELPGADAYEDYCQIENGVGLLRKFEEEFTYALAGRKPGREGMVELDSASGVSAAPFMAKLFEKLLPYGVRIRVHPVANRYFGETVTVSGLITAGDILAQLRGNMAGDTLIIPSTMLREGDEVFLDGMKLQELEWSLGARVAPLCAGDGERFIEELFELISEV